MQEGDQQFGPETVWFAFIGIVIKTREQDFVAVHFTTI